MPIFAIQSQNIFEGKKSPTQNSFTSPATRPRAFHMSSVHDQALEINSSAKNILASPEFKNIYNTKVAFFPKIQFSQDVSQQSRISRAIARHLQVIQNIEKFEVIGLMQVDIFISSQENRSPHKLILSIKSSEI